MLDKKSCRRARIQDVGVGKALIQKSITLINEITTLTNIKGMKTN